MNECNEVDTQGTATDSLRQAVDGVRNSSSIGSRNGREKLTYEDIFYREKSPKSKTYQKLVGGGTTRAMGIKQSTDSRCGKEIGATPTSRSLRYGFPRIGRGWCTGELKKIRIPTYARRMVPQIQRGILQTGAQTEFSDAPREQGANLNTVQYIGIAADEPKRIERHKDKAGILMPLVEAGWTEPMCREWCEQNDLLAPTYTTSMRGGCWFCHNQSIGQLRLLRHNHPELWAILLNWDLDSPVSFKADGHTVHDFDKRFEFEDKGLVDPKQRFNWNMLKEHQITIDDLLKGL